jgi:hypothetical protein
VLLILSLPLSFFGDDEYIGDDVWLLRVSFNSTMESLPLQLCSQPLTGNSFAIDRLGNLPVSCALHLIPSSLFLETTATLETMFGYNAYHLILHWNHYRTSTLLSAIDWQQFCH